MKLQTRPQRETADHSTTLSKAISRLEDLTDRMRSDGLHEEAASLQTTINGLHWQYEELID